MALSLLDAHSAFIEALAQFVTRLKKLVRERSSVLKVCAQVGITRDMYYQRLRYPHNIEQSEVEIMADFLQEPDLLTTFRSAYQAALLIAGILTQYVRDATITVAFLCRKLGIHPSTYYRKQKDPRLWNRGQLEQIVKIVETVRGLGSN